MQVIDTQVIGTMPDGTQETEIAVDRNDADTLAQAMKERGFVVIKIVEHVA